VPDIDDWSKPYKELRTQKDWWNMPNIKWLIFHSLAYKWVLFYICLGSTLVFSAIFWYFLVKEVFIISFIALIIAFRMAIATYKKIKTWKVLNTLNFYDLLFREY